MWEYWLPCQSESQRTVIKHCTLLNIRTSSFLTFLFTRVYLLFCCLLVGFPPLCLFCLPYVDHFLSSPVFLSPLLSTPSNLLLVSAFLSSSTSPSSYPPLSNLLKEGPLVVAPPFHLPSHQIFTWFPLYLDKNHRLQNSSIPGVPLLAP